jgi:hypothetical protein
VYFAYRDRVVGVFVRFRALPAVYRRGRFCWQHKQRATQDKAFCDRAVSTSPAATADKILTMKLPI